MTKTDNAVTRRRFLTVAGGIVGVSCVPMGVAAKKDSTVKNECPPGTALLAKYEFEDGELVFEKDSDYLEVGDAFEITDVVTKEEGEILAFDFEDPNGIYDVYEISVQAGNETYRKDIGGSSGSFDVREYDDSMPVQAISNFILCARVWWQVDFGRGEVDVPPNYSDGNGRKEDLVLAATGDGTTESIDNPSYNRDGTLDYVDVDPESFDIDLDAGTATVEFTDNGEGEQLHLASFETPGQYKRSEYRYQDLFEVVYTSAESGSLTIDIPTPDDYS